jgi:Beta-propeller repeat
MNLLRLLFLFLVGTGTLAFAQSNSKDRLPAGLSGPDPAVQGKTVEAYGNLPLSFEANQGQTGAEVKFLSRGSGYTLFLTGDEAVFSMRASKAVPSVAGHHSQREPVEPTTNAVLRMKLVKANPAAKVTGEDELPGKSNYFIGNDAKQWRSNVPTYGKVKYEGIYSGIDLVYYGNQRRLEYDFVVAPGADPRRIQFDVRGAKHISRDKNGDLVIRMTGGEVHWRKPVVYQERDGRRREIDGNYVIRRGQRVGFELAGYDSKRPLIIDPVLGYSTYLGGSGTDNGYGIAVDSSGNAYVTGVTFSTVPDQPS